jgi:hypothetical protein
MVSRCAGGVTISFSSDFLLSGKGFVLRYEIRTPRTQPAMLPAHGAAYKIYRAAAVGTNSTDDPDWEAINTEDEVSQTCSTGCDCYHAELPHGNIVTSSGV